MINHQIEEISPERAKVLLKTNVKNRNLSTQHVDFLARLMLGDDWVFNGDAIRFDLKGNLIDGQHRLAAVIKSGVTINAVVIRGVDPSAFSTIDSGRARTASDVLYAEGYKYQTSIAAMSQCLMRLIDSGFKTAICSGGLKKSHSEVLDFVKKHPEITDSAKVASSKPLSQIIPKKIVGASHFLLNSISPTVTAKMFNVLANGGEIDCPANALREYLTKKALMQQKFDVNFYLACICKTFDKLISSEKSMRFSAPKKPQETIRSILLINTNKEAA